MHTYFFYVDNYEFAKVFWSFVIKSLQPNDLKQNTRVYWRSTYGTELPNTDYCQWFARNLACLPTTLNACQPSSTIFAETKEIKDLCGVYVPFCSIALPQNSSWMNFFQFKTELSLHDCCHLLEKIREDEKFLEENQDRIQMIYSCLLKRIGLLTPKEYSCLREQKKPLHFLSENNQWRLTNELYYYLENDGLGSHLNDAIPSLKLDYRNKMHPQLIPFLQFFAIKQIKINDLKLVDHQSENATQFKEKLIQISPFIKTWLKTTAFTSNTILSIDRILQEEIDFIESNCLELVYHDSLVQETSVYFDTMHQQFYVCRPWNSETTMMDLPRKLCQLLHIEGFEEKLRFLLKASVQEVTQHFRKNSIETPKKEDIVVLNRLPRAGQSRQRISWNYSECFS